MPNKYPGNTITPILIPPGSYLTGDLNKDGLVNSFDYAIIDDNFGTGVTSRPSAPPSSTEVFIPEPASLTLLALPGLLLTRRRS